jgi:hypothetical protein
MTVVSSMVPVALSQYMLYRIIAELPSLSGAYHVTEMLVLSAVYLTRF